VTRLNRTLAAAIGADDVGMDEHAVVDVIAHLTAREFDKAMRSGIDPTIWQDVYEPIVGSRELYVKFTLDGIPPTLTPAPARLSSHSGGAAK